MVILKHINPNEMDSRYSIADESDLLIAADRIEMFLHSVDQTLGQSQKNSSQTESRNGICNCFNCGAEGETRTRTGVRPLDPEPSASTSSATSAR